MSKNLLVFLLSYDQYHFISEETDFFIELDGKRYSDPLEIPYLNMLAH